MTTVVLRPECTKPCRTTWKNGRSLDWITKNRFKDLFLDFKTHGHDSLQNRWKVTCLRVGDLWWLVLLGWKSLIKTNYHQVKINKSLMTYSVLWRHAGTSARLQRQHL